MDTKPYIAQWCLDGWEVLRERTVHYASQHPGLIIRPMDPSRPLHEQASLRINPLNSVHIAILIVSSL